VGFLVGLRDEFFDNLGVVAALAVGGVIAAPLAAWLVSRVSPALLGTAVGGIIVLTNSQKLVHYFGIEWPWSSFIYSVIVVAWAVFLVLAWRIMRAPAYVPQDLEAEVAVIERPAETADEVR
jgi:large-conductance mechanosensitive channel